MQVEFQYKNAQAALSRRLVILEKQQELLQLSKEKACSDIDACFDGVIQVQFTPGLIHIEIWRYSFTVISQLCMLMSLIYCQVKFLGPCFQTWGSEGYNKPFYTVFLGFMF